MLGIAIATYNRSANLVQLIESIRRTLGNENPVVVCNDGSKDDTIAQCQAMKVLFVGRENRGIAWNKNRGLYWLVEKTKATSFLLLEDDISVSNKDWSTDWAEAIKRWGHVTWADQNLVKHRIERFIAGEGSPASPYVLKYVTGQVMGFSREALASVGYFDTRFRGYGYEHIDLSRRIHRKGFGTTTAKNNVSSEVETGYVNISGGISITDLPTVSDRSTTEENRMIYEKIRGNAEIRMPWSNDEEQAIFLDEIHDAEQRAASL